MDRWTNILLLVVYTSYDGGCEQVGLNTLSVLYFVGHRARIKL